MSLFPLGPIVTISWYSRIKKKKKQKTVFNLNYEPLWASQLALVEKNMPA